MYQGIEGQEWEAMYCHQKELHQAVRTKKKSLHVESKGESFVGHESGKRWRRQNLSPNSSKNIPERTHPNPLGHVGRTLEKSSGCFSEGAGMFGVE